MKPEAQRIAIAEARGWTDCPIIRSTVNGRMYYGQIELPDYLNDLNAMHEARAAQAWDSETMRQYENHLHEIVAPHYTITAPLYVWCMMNATAKQHAEAFLRTLNLWKP